MPPNQEPTDEQIITALSPMGIIHKVDIELYRAGWRAAQAAAPPIRYMHNIDEAEKVYIECSKHLTVGGKIAVITRAMTKAFHAGYNEADPPYAPAAPPIEPTPEMIRIGVNTMSITGGNVYQDVAAMWRAMYAAAPPSAPTPAADDLADAIAERNANSLLACAYGKQMVKLEAENAKLWACVRAADEMRADAYQVDVSHKDEDDFRWEDRPTSVALAYDDARAAAKGAK